MGTKKKNLKKNLKKSTKIVIKQEKISKFILIKYQDFLRNLTFLYLKPLKKHIKLQNFWQQFKHENLLPGCIYQFVPGSV